MIELSGKRVLLVEDEAILAMALEDILGHLGCVVVGPALTVADGHRLASDAQLDAGVLDINMGNGPNFTIAEILRTRSVPFCFSTGYGLAGVPSQYADVPVLQKPYSDDRLAAMLRTMLG